MLKDLFVFPIIMVDGDNEERKDILGLSNDAKLDVITGEAECPYYDFISVCDRWLPTDESFDNAMNGKFDACGVNFQQSGTFIVPWNKERFKRELSKFIASLPPKEPVVKFVTKKEALKLLKEGE